MCHLMTVNESILMMLYQYVSFDGSEWVDFDDAVSVCVSFDASEWVDMLLYQRVSLDDSEWVDFGDVVSVCVIWC